MKIILLHKLRRNLILEYYPETNKNREYWTVEIKDSRYNANAYYSFEEALHTYHCYLSNKLSRYLDSKNKKRIL